MSKITPSQVNTFVSTDQPSKYINRLCRHFSHKVEAEWADSKGVITFSIGRCDLAVVDNGLSIRCQAPDGEQLEELMDVVKSHFDRFAVQDNLVMEWNSLSTCTA